METDVHILGYVCEHFRNLCFDMYDLDAAHFYTAPGLAWQAALKMTDIKLELLTDLYICIYLWKRGSEEALL